ncbi:hypothetical protein J2795_001762 [Chryseobacterium bernardetii]|uniref:DUF4440 domain-containing protein n=2 Tax=Chryseobacterium TaxID=59732 RepID=A0A543EI47_9FLAO|nr:MULTISPECIES: hypothetical protein [Chryseobacterium]MDR6371192.1 hypothetical protein [Chryseobacterium vietnamense]MDR6441062.1 hypothetical protein [Chryseobacterium bernardetii]TQM21262.1 hypothetical protein FB551_0944 [Chryseobacterium aquifrigidense]
MNNTEKIIGEIEGFHRNIEKWFQGKTEDQESLYKELLSGFSTDFKMINGNGDTVTLSMLEHWLPSVFGKFPERNIEVENIEVQYSDHHGLATYTETQVTGETANKRQSSAVFLLNEEKALWLHLIENWM